MLWHWDIPIENSSASVHLCSSENIHVKKFFLEIEHFTGITVSLLSKIDNKRCIGNRLLAASEPKEIVKVDNRY